MLLFFLSFEVTVSSLFTKDLCPGTSTTLQCDLIEGVNVNKNIFFNEIYSA
jgi:hypothetical protein